MMCYSGIGLTALIVTTFYLINDLSLDYKTKCCIGLSIFLSNSSILSTSQNFNTSQMFILSRYNVVNNILLQLLFDNPETKERIEIVDDRSRKELQYTKYRNNFSSKNVLLRDQLEISTITKTENILRKKEDLKKQKIKLEKLEKIDAPSFVHMIELKNKSQVYQIVVINKSCLKRMLADTSLSIHLLKNQLLNLLSKKSTNYLLFTINLQTVSII